MLWHCVTDQDVQKGSWKFGLSQTGSQSDFDQIFVSHTSDHIWGVQPRDMSLYIFIRGCGHGAFWLVCFAKKQSGCHLAICCQIRVKGHMCYCGLLLATRNVVFCVVSLLWVCWALSHRIRKSPRSWWQLFIWACGHDSVVNINVSPWMEKLLQLEYTSSHLPQTSYVYSQLQRHLDNLTKQPLH